MSSRPVRRRVLAEVERAGGWPAVLTRIASGEQITEIARSFGVSRSFFGRLLHEDHDRHALTAEARRWAAGAALLAEAAAMIGGRSRPGAERLRSGLGMWAAALDRATLRRLDRLRAALEGGGADDETARGAIPEGRELMLELAWARARPDVGRLHLEALHASMPKPLLRTPAHAALPAGEAVEPPKCGHGGGG